jgi:hypothetical protein
LILNGRLDAAGQNLARFWRDQGRPQQARELLAPVFGWFMEDFDTRPSRDQYTPTVKLAKNSSQ